MTIDPLFPRINEFGDPLALTTPSQAKVPEVVWHGSQEAEFDAAFARAQGNFAPIPRSRTVQVAMRTGGTYTFAYAPLETILAACVPALSAEGISLRQHIRIDSAFEDPLHFLVTTMSRAGISMSNEVLIFKGDPTAQAYGSAVTYARRMGVTLLLCVAPDDDNDGNVEGLKSPPTQHPAKPPQKPQEPANGKPATHAPPAAPQPKAVGEPPKKPASKPPSEIEISRLEGQVVDAVGEMQEACVEGRSIGIQQIWDEIKGNEYVAQRVWREMKTQTPDLFAIMQGVLKPAGDKTPRGAKPKDEVQS